MTTKVCLLELRECMYKVGISPLFVFFFFFVRRSLWEEFVCCSKCSGQFLWQASVCVCHKPDVLATCLGGEAACFSISLLFVGLPRFAPPVVRSVNGMKGLPLKQKHPQQLFLQPLWVHLSTGSSSWKCERKSAAEPKDAGSILGCCGRLSDEGFLKSKTRVEILAHVGDPFGQN